MSTPAGGDVVGDAQINVDANTAPADRALRDFSRDVNNRLRDARGRFVSTSQSVNSSLASIGRGGEGVSGALDEVRKSALLLSPALVPVAAAALSVGASVGAAGLAVGVFGAALGPQISALGDATEAEEKYTEAVEENGATSKKAAEAQNAYVRQVEKMPPATRQAAAALSSLKDQYQEWSDSLAADTAPVVTKAIEALGAVFPKLTPLVKGTSRELDRFVTIARSGIASPGLDKLIASFTEFSTDVLRRANDALVKFIRTSDTDVVSSGFGKFLAYAKENGPVVRDTVESVVEALLNVAEAAADVGPGLLTVVNALAGIVSAVPPGVITVLLQLAVAIRAVRVAAALAGGISTAMTAFAASLGSVQTAAAGATGVLPRVAAAFSAMSRTVKLAVAGTGIGLLVIALTELSEAGRQVPPDVDKLTTAFGELGRSGKVVGEASKTLGADLSGLHDRVSALTDPSTVDSIQQWIVTLGGIASWDSTPVKDAKENLDAIDKSLANLVSSGRADLAAAAQQRLTAAYGKGGRDTKEFTSSLDDYDNALKNVEFEQQLAAESMGLFGQQAILTKQKMDAQKQSTDGLRLAITALNEVNRAGISAQIAFEQALDAGTEAAQKFTGVFKASGGQLDLNSKKGRDAATALNDLASKTDAAAEAARESGASWQTVNGIYDKGRKALLSNAQQMGLNTQAAKTLADQILKTPDKTARLRGNIEDLEGKLKTAKDQLSKVPDSRRAQVRANIDQLESQLRSARRQLNNLPDARVGVSLFIKPSAADKDGNGIPDYVQARANGGLVGFAGGGKVSGPGGSRSDKIPLLASNGEFVMRAKAVRDYGLDFMRAVNSGRMSTGVASAASLGVGSTAGRQVINVTYSPNVTISNGGVIGSQLELQNWLVRALDTTARMGRLPRSLVTGA